MTPARRRASGPALCLVLAAAIAQATPPALASERVGIGVKVGTLGLGLDLTGRLADWFSLRGTANVYDTTRSFEEEGIDYEGDLSIGAYGLLADFHPARGNFRISLGWMKNRNGADIEAVPTAPIEIGDGVYTPAEVGALEGEIAFDDSAPYFGIGYGCAALGPGRVRFVLDVGVMRQGAGSATLTSTTGLVSDADLQAEVEELEEDLEDEELWPVLAFGISFRL